MHFVDAKGILSAGNGMNIYRGCTHGCIYCDSRSRCYGFTHSFEDIEVKQNAPVLLEQRLRSKRKKCMIGTGSMCDPYMHCEEKLGLTRKCLELVEKGLVTDQLVLTVGYDIENLKDPERRRRYAGPVTTDGYGRQVPKRANGSVNLNGYTSSTREMVGAIMELYSRIVDPSLLVRRMSVTANHLLAEQDVIRQTRDVQLDLFSDRQAEMTRQMEREREHRMQQALVSIRKRYGKNAVLKGISYKEGATAREQNGQIGGHRA